MLAATTFLFALTLPFSATAQLTFTLISSVTSDLSTSEDATYSCTFKNRWSQSRHSALYPKDARWAPPVLAAHNSRKFSMWNSQSLATEGVKEITEKGVSTKLVGEMRDSPNVGDFVIGAPQTAVGEQVLPDVTVTLDTTHLSSIARMAPSPDFFTGFRNFNAANSAEQLWYESFTLETFPWDAGTEKGDSYVDTNDAESPQRRITRFTTANIRSNRIFVSTTPSGQNRILPVATWVCKLV